MKNEDRIIELLAEYLKKTDQTSDELKPSHAILIEHAKQFKEHSKGLDQQNQELIELRKETIKREIQQEALLKEIFSISKRAMTIENK